MTACDCIRALDALLKPNNRRLDTMWMLVEGASMMRPSLTASPIEKKRGERPTSIVADFCPFCGVEYAPKAAS